VHVFRAGSIDEFRSALEKAKQHEGGPVMVHVETDPVVPAPSSESWWDVPVAAVSDLDSTREARRVYQANKAAQRQQL
jgi:3D-(3,5/4)-trihydroxycyclohexane-1,2-dione acylhydrolase (decyclizing)